LLRPRVATGLQPREPERMTLDNADPTCLSWFAIAFFVGVTVAGGS
jgi:hypothetical protein